YGFTVELASAGREERLLPDWPYQLNGPIATLPKVRPLPVNGIEKPIPPSHTLRRVPERPKVNGPKRNRKPIVVTGVQILTFAAGCTGTASCWRCAILPLISPRCSSI